MTNEEQEKPPFYIEKALEYTVKGVEILRAETIQLFNDRNSYLSWGSAAITILFYSAATSNYNYPFLTYIMNAFKTYNSSFYSILDNGNGVHSPVQPSKSIEKMSVLSDDQALFLN